MEKYIIQIFIFLLLTSCNYIEEKKTLYIGYYDDSQTMVKMKGNLENDIEQGEWKYFNENGKLIQSGNYKDGYQVGKWVYNYENILDTSILWTINTFDKFRFSLPETFQESFLDSNKLLYTAIDKASGDVFSIKNNIASPSDMDNYFQKTKDEFTYDFNILTQLAVTLKIHINFS